MIIPTYLVRGPDLMVAIVTDKLDDLIAITGYLILDVGKSLIVVCEASATIFSR
jgi:hypothetical protein